MLLNGRALDRPFTTQWFLSSYLFLSLSDFGGERGVVFGRLDRCRLELLGASSKSIFTPSVPPSPLGSSVCWLFWYTAAFSHSLSLSRRERQPAYAEARVRDWLLAPREGASEERVSIQRSPNGGAIDDRTVRSSNSAGDLLDI